MPSKIQTFFFNLTTDVNGDISKVTKLVSDIIIGMPTAFKDGAFESREFFNLYVYTRKPESDYPTGGGSDGGGSGGAGGAGATFLSRPKLAGALFRRGEELVVKIEAGIDNAASLYHVLIPYQVID